LHGLLEVGQVPGRRDLRLAWAWRRFLYEMQACHSGGGKPARALVFDA